MCLHSVLFRLYRLSVSKGVYSSLTLNRLDIVSILLIVLSNPDKLNYAFLCVQESSLRDIGSMERLNLSNRRRSASRRRLLLGTLTVANASGAANAHSRETGEPLYIPALSLRI